MIQTQVTIVNKLGLHARAAAKLVACTAAFSSNIQIGSNEKMVDGKSIMSVMMLAASKGTILALEIDGHDEQEALIALQRLVQNRFEESE